MKRKAKVIKTVQTSNTDTMTEEEFIDLPLKGEEMEGPATVKAMVMGGASFNYQSVKFSAEVVIENVDISEIPEAQQMAEQACFQHIEEMEPRAQKLLDTLVETQDQR